MGGGYPYEIGIGYSWISSDFQPLYNGDTVNFKMNNVAVFIEYNFYHTDKIYADISVNLGISKLSYKKENQLLANTFALFYEPAMTLEYRFLRFFGIGMGAGYRLVLFDHKQINEKLSSPIYIFRFKVYFGDIYRKHFKKQ